MSWSSSNGSDSRRRSQRALPARRLVRKSSSFLSKIQSFVPAPLSRLFSGADEFDDSKDDMGKRRRVEGGQNEPAMAMSEDGPGPAKKLRRRSPDRQPQSRQSAYLDPPAAVFNHQQTGQANPDHNRLHSLNVSLPTVDFPRNEPRTTLSPLRNQFSSSLRTMSVDPPQSSSFSQRLTRDVSMRNVSSFALRDQSMEPAAGSSLIRPLNFSRDTSLPHGNSGLFRMRTSMTPQPPREVSEPPTLNSLGSKPVFVRTPAVEASATSRTLPTLGDIAQDHRRTQSPVRQHSSTSLLFGTQPSTQLKARPVNKATRALQDLDAYKTPLQPTRVRENKSQLAFGADPSDMFSRKKSYQRMPGARGPAAKNANKTKPYAGEAGIKKHLARNKLAVAEERQAAEADTPLRKDDSMAGDAQQEPPKDLKLPEDKGETFKPIDKKSTIPSQSSLRVGRTYTSRNHIDRPAARPAKSKFSASFDEDDEDKDDEESKKEREMMEEAAKHVPVFTMPAGFSFSKDTPPIQHDENAKEPPITSLPFSFAGSSSTIPGRSAVATPSEGPAESDPPTPSAPVNVGGTSDSPATSGAVPNFFSNSKALHEPAPAPVAPLNFSLPVPQSSQAPPSLPFSLTPKAAPVAVNKVDGGKESGLPFTFSAPATEKSMSSGLGASSVSGSLFGQQKNEVNAPAAASKSLFASPSDANVKPSPFSFSKPVVSESTAPKPVAENSSDSQRAAQTLFGVPAPATNLSSSSAASISSPFTFGAPTTNAASAPGGMFTFGAPKVATASSEAPAVDSSKSFAFGASLPTPKDDAPVKAPFSFGTPTPTTEAPKTPFAFGAPKEDPPKRPTFSLEQSTAPQSNGASQDAPKTGFAFGSSSSSQANGVFSFGGAVSTPVADAGENKGFAFPSPSTAPASPATGFSFANGSTSAAAAKPFAFGTSAPARPATPPNQDMGMDSMDESPTRDVSAPKIAEPRPSLGGGFSFGNATSSGFGAQTNAPPTSTTPTFGFGASSSASNPFAKTDKPDETKGGFGGFGQSNNTGFSFNRKVEDPPRPATAGSFSFGSPTSAPASGTAFPFGGPGNNSTGSTTFPSGPLSAPNSPSTFNNATASPSFAFGALPATTNPFGFGSQPASPAPGNTTLPSSGFGGGSTNGFGAPATAAPSNPFGAPTTPSASGGGSLFTIGAAPSAALGGARQIKKLPNRRTVKR